MLLFLFIFLLSNLRILLERVFSVAILVTFTLYVLLSRISSIKGGVEVLLYLETLVAQ